MHVNRDQWSAYKTAPAMSANGKLIPIYERARAYKSGQMAVCMRGTGRRIKPTSSAGFSIKMATFIKVNGKMIKRMALATISIRMAACTEDFGRTTRKTARVLNAGLMAPNSRVTTARESSKVTEFSLGLTEIATREISSQTIFKAKVGSQG